MRASLPDGAGGPRCEVLSAGALAEPVAAVTSLAFVVGGLLIVAAPHRHRRYGFAALVAGIGLGSLVQHGPNPSWADPVHDLPLLATLAFVAADAVAALTGRRRRWWWWAAPTAALLPVIVLAPRAGDLAQVGIAVVAVAGSLLRAQAFPTVRRRTVAAVGLLAVGGVVDALSRTGGPLCVPESLWQGHGAWHVLVATALVVLAPVVGHGTHLPPRRALDSSRERRGSR